MMRTVHYARKSYFSRPTVVNSNPTPRRNSRTQSRTQGGGGARGSCPNGCMTVHNKRYYRVNRGHPEGWK